MTDKYEALRKAAQRRNISCHPDVIAAYRYATEPTTILELLAERDRLREALEAAITGLDWYRERIPGAVDGSDDEMDALIAAALNQETAQ